MSCKKCQNYRKIKINLKYVMEIMVMMTTTVNENHFLLYAAAAHS